MCTDFGNLLGRLTDLHMHDNMLTSLPASLGQLTQLKVLDVHNNRLDCLPDELCDLVNLRWLLAGGNTLTGTATTSSLLDPFPCAILSQPHPHTRRVLCCP